MNFIFSDYPLTSFLVILEKLYIHSHLYLFMISNDFKDIFYKFIIVYKNNNEVFLTSLLLISYSFHNVLFDGNHMCFL